MSAVALLFSSALPGGLNIHPAVSLGTLVSVARASRKERRELVYLQLYSKLVLTPTQNRVKRCFIENTGGSKKKGAGLVMITLLAAGRLP